MKIKLLFRLVCSGLVWWSSACRPASVRLASHEGSFKFQMLQLIWPVYLWKQRKMAWVLGSLCPCWRPGWSTGLQPSPALASLAIWEVSQWMENLFSLFLSLTLPFQMNKSWKTEEPEVCQLLMVNIGRSLWRVHSDGLRDCVVMCLTLLWNVSSSLCMLNNVTAAALQQSKFPVTRP